MPTAPFIGARKVLGGRNNGSCFDLHPPRLRDPWNSAASEGEYYPMGPPSAGQLSLVEHRFGFHGPTRLYGALARLKRGAIAALGDDGLCPRARQGPGSRIEDCSCCDGLKSDDDAGDCAAPWFR